MQKHILMNQDLDDILNTITCMGNDKLVSAKSAKNGLFKHDFFHKTIQIYQSLKEDEIRHCFYIFDNYFENRFNEIIKSKLDELFKALNNRNHNMNPLLIQMAIIYHQC
jgi:hypothetical protein